MMDITVIAESTPGPIAINLATYVGSTQGGILGALIATLAEAGIKLYGGVQGNADHAVNALLSGNLAYDPDAKCDHHDHEEGHECGHGDHECGHGGYHN